MTGRKKKNKPKQMYGNVAEKMLKKKDIQNKETFGKKMFPYFEF